MARYMQSQNYVEETACLHNTFIQRQTKIQAVQVLPSEILSRAFSGDGLTEKHPNDVLLNFSLV